MNPVVILTLNCLDLTKKCVDSVWRQDIPTDILVYDNGSTDGTIKWALDMPEIDLCYFHLNNGVSIGWNTMLSRLFDEGEPHVLVLNNDTTIPPYFYRKLLSYDVPFVTGISVDEPKDHPDCWTQPAESPDFSAFLIRRECWLKVGSFDERMKLYASDNDYHIRAHMAGIKLLNAGVPFHHERSSTLRNAGIFDQEVINRQADTDRMVFREKWGCYPWEPAYAALLGESNVR